jgi:valyl-tRNA synthetase
MDSKYEHNLYEKKIYDAWINDKSGGEHAGGAFNPDNYQSKNNKKPYTVIMPPPNANDPLHVGHAMFATLEDIMVRYHRMCGDDTLWLPGADHAGIETQFVFEKKLQKAGSSRFQLDRETLYQQIWDYVADNKGVAREQLERLGVSCDWSRYKFTLDSDIVQTVLGSFMKLNEQKLVYRALRLVNYCPKCGTAFSDLEVKHEEKKSPLYYIKYGPFVLATTRPETKFGDTAVAVNPEDERYKDLVGQEIEVQGVIGKFKVKVIADEYVDKDFGTGAVKITPYHDHNDWEVWQRHKDELPEPKQVIGFDGRMTKLCGKYAGIKVAQAREQIVKDMDAMGLIDHIDNDYENKLSTCYRCGNTLEPLPMAQFFIKVAPLTEPILEDLEKNKFMVHGAGHDKILAHWLKNLKDWNISRQIVWGIRLPVWYEAAKNPDLQVSFIDNNGRKYHDKLGDLLKVFSLGEIKKGLQSLDANIASEFVVSLEAPGENYVQETDTFDTWFSSSQWPFATLQNTRPGDFERFYPTALMETGYDILPFWVMRMLMMGKWATGELPFTEVYLHGLIRDQKGQKMSKSKGNVINPIEVADKYGADALRFALVVRSTPGLDKSVGDADFKAARNFTNKLWNSARFLTMLEKTVENGEGDEEFAAKIASAATEVTEALEKYKPGLAADLVYDSFWHYFCDEAIEKCKAGEISLAKLTWGLKVYLRLLHPFVPFVTEQIWQELGKMENDENTALLIRAGWPEAEV